MLQNTAWDVIKHDMHWNVWITNLCGHANGFSVQSVHVFSYCSDVCVSLVSCVWEKLLSAICWILTESKIKAHTAGHAIHSYVIRYKLQLITFIRQRGERLVVVVVVFRKSYYLSDI